MTWLRMIVVVCVALFGSDVPALAQTPAAAPNPGEVASDPIRCWWKADRTAVRVGERFGLVVTCGVIETGAVTVVPVLNQLEPGALSLTPFEVASGTRREDVVAPPWRYIQFEYAVRLLSEGFFSQDVNIPALTVTYNVRAPGGGTQGRDQGYILPALPMRILSLVPGAATDIRDASGQTFATIESRRFRASAALVAAGISFAFATVLAAFAAVRLAGRFRARRATALASLPVPSLLRGCLHALAEVKKDVARDGWTPELARRAAAPFRIAGAIALGRRLTQDVVGKDALQRDGQLAVRTGLTRRRRALLSAATTTTTIAASLSNGQGPRPRARANLESLSETLRVLGVAGYGRNGHADTSLLDAALDDGTRAVRRIRVGTFWPMRAVDAVVRSFRGA